MIARPQAAHLFSLMVIDRSEKIRMRARIIFLCWLLNGIGMEIKETLMTKAFSVMNPDPYFLALKAMEEIAKSEKVVERVNKYESDGPHHRCMVNFDAVDNVDDFSSIVFNFDLHGEDGLLRVNVTGSLDTKIEELGFFGNSFADHYAGNIFPVLHKITEDKIKFFGHALDGVFGTASE